MSDTPPLPPGKKYPPPPKGAAVRAAVLVAITMFMAQLDSTIIQTAIPAMADFFKVRPVDLGQGITLFVLAQVMLLPAASWIADRFGIRAVFAWAVIGFTVTSLLCAISQTLDQFLIFRFLQGASAALMTPVGRLAMVRNAARAELLSVMNIASTPMLIAPTIGPAVGGFLTTYLSWQYIFYLNVPIGIAAIVLILRWLPRGEVQRLPFDTFGFFACSAALTGLLFGLDMISIDAFSPLAWGLTAFAAVISFFAWRHITRHPTPILSPSPLKDRVFNAVTLGAGGFIRLPSRALPFILPLMFQINFGWSAFQAGIAMLFFSAGDLLTKPFVTKIFRQVGFRPALTWNAVLLSAVTAATAFFTSDTPFWLICGVLSLTGVFRSIIFSGMAAVIYADIPRDDFNAASLIWSIMQQATSALAVSLSVLVINIAALAHGRDTGHPALVDCRIAIVFFVFLGLASAWSFSRLSPDVGARIRNRTP